MAEFIHRKDAAVCRRYAGEPWAKVQAAAEVGNDGLRVVPSRSSQNGCLSPEEKMEEGETFTLRRCQTMTWGEIATVYEQRF